MWLVYMAGVNGYMLPWDRLAQFVTQASFEWIDWLPGFGGTLIRNFISPEHVSDRLFSLLVFIHIGVPLLTLLLMWVHVQRVPKATTQPPRPIALALGVDAAGAGAGRAGGQPGRRPTCAASPAELALDWFLLGALPAGLRLAAGRACGRWCSAPTLLLLAAALAAAAAQQPGPALQLTLHPGAGARRRARRRDAARSRPARRPGPALRLPRRRLRPVHVHGAQRPRRPGAVPARRRSATRCARAARR